MDYIAIKKERKLRTYNLFLLYRYKFYILVKNNVFRITFNYAKYFDFQLNLEYDNKHFVDI